MIRRREGHRGSEAALSVAGAIGVALGLDAGGLAIALAGLGVLTPDIDPAAVPGWLWYYRADPRVQLWVAIGAGAVLALSGLIALSRRRGRSRYLEPKQVRGATCTVEISPGGAVRIQLGGAGAAHSAAMSVRLRRSVLAPRDTAGGVHRTTVRRKGSP